MEDTKSSATPFRREWRYIVVKRKRITAEQEIELMGWLSERAIEPVECVVVENDWPEHQAVWDMIERRCTANSMFTPTLESDRKAAREFFDEVSWVPTSGQLVILADAFARHRAAAPMTDTKPSDVEGLIAKLRKPIDADKLYDWIVKARKQTRSDFPRQGFAVEMDLIDEERSEAATTLAAQQARVAELEASIGRLMTDLQQHKDALAQVGKEPS